MNDLIQKLESYNWTDELGHPLVNCVEWEELKEWVLAQERVLTWMKASKLMDEALSERYPEETEEIKKWREQNRLK